MNRREVLSRVAVLMGGVILSPSLMAFSAKEESESADNLTLFSPKQRKTLIEITETIIPKTKTPGAKEAKCAACIEVVLQDCYKSKEQDAFKTAIDEVDKYAVATFGKSFVKLSAANRISCLSYFEKKSIAKENTYFSHLKEMTLFAYFTSKEGITQQLKHIEIPGKWEGDILWDKDAMDWGE